MQIELKQYNMNKNEIEDAIISSETSSLRVREVVSIPSGEGKAKEIATNDSNRQPRSTRVMVLSATTAAAVMVLAYRSSGGTVPSIVSTSSSLSYPAQIFG